MWVIGQLFCVWIIWQFFGGKLFGSYCVCKLFGNCLFLVQWDQECLAFLLRLITQFSIDASDIEAGHDDVFETYESPRKKLRKQKQQDKIIIPRLDQVSMYVV